MRWNHAIVAVAMLLSIPASVKAAALPSGISLTLDQGFVARPVSLDLFQGQVNVSWGADLLTSTSTLTVTLAQGATTSNDQQLAGPALSISFSNASSVDATKTIHVAFVAVSSPPLSGMTSGVSATDATTTIIDGMSLRGKISFLAPATASSTLTPVYRAGMMHEGTASWYSYKHCLCAASPDVPKGTRLIVRRADKSSKYVVVTVNDWGPERDKFPNRVIDLDKVAFKRLGNTRGGVLQVTVDVVKPTDPLWKKAGEIPPPNWKKLWAALQTASAASSKP